MQDVVEDHLPHTKADAPAGEDGQTYTLLKNLVAVLTAMWAGFWISKGVCGCSARRFLPTSARCWRPRCSGISTT